MKHEFPAFVAKIVSLAKVERSGAGRGIADRDYPTLVFERDFVAAGRQLRAAYVEGEGHICLHSRLSIGAVDVKQKGHSNQR
jgi:hypothetical protein